MKQEVINKIFNKVKKQGDCLIWVAKNVSKGYGLIYYKGGNRQAHRLLYELTVKKLPKNIVLDHLCRNRGCLNVKHLEPVTHRENILRGIGIAAQNARKTHCKNGHLFSKENTAFYKTKLAKGRKWRTCKECMYISRKRFKKRLVAKAEAKADN